MYQSMNLIKPTFSFLLVSFLLCLTGSISAQSIPDLSGYSWKTKSAALEVLEASLKQGPTSLAALTSVTASSTSAGFEQLLFQVVANKISGNIPISTAIQDGFAEATSSASNDPQYNGVSSDEQEEALIKLIDLIKE
jgi:hypothetical protein